jgi:hypothetical protein
LEAFVLNKYDDNSTYETRAQQAYSILIALASNRQTVTYRLLSEKMNYGGGRGDILAWPLGRIMRWCKANELPALTSLVVDAKTGLPSSGLTTVEADAFPAEQQRVYLYDWFSVLPPTGDELMLQA